jgi:hypothetical protein
MHDDLLQSPKVSVHADTQLAIQFNNDHQYWKEMLKRIITVIKFLASRGLPLRGDNQTIDSVKNVNCMGIMELRILCFIEISLVFLGLLITDRHGISYSFFSKWM